MAPALQTMANSAMPYAFRRKPAAGDQHMSGAGVLFMTQDGEALFLKRGSKSMDHAGEWCLPGGLLDGDEEPSAAARREALEETGHLPAWDLAPLHREISEDGVDFTTFGQPVTDKFDPRLDELEHDEAVWASVKDPPQPLHPGVAALLAKYFAEEAEEPQHQTATDSALRLAFDKDTVREFDPDGRLHVRVANISKANICPYLGKEIPGYEELGLEAEKIYQLLRDPEELRKAAPTFNSVQVLKKHNPVNAEDHRPYDVVGTTGSDATFEHPYLRNSLKIWSQDAIDDIESKEKRELSCGYHYRPEMTPGIFDGKPFDGIMRDIIGNHVALVEDGRAGPDVIVGDSSENLKMTLPTRFANLALQLTARAVHPVLAQDAKINLMPIFKDITTKNFDSKKIMAAVQKELKGKMAKDASLEHLAHLLDHFESPSKDESVSKEQHNAMEAAAHGHSTLGIPENVGKEFSEADKGKSFDHKSARDNLGAHLREKGMDEESIKAACDAAFGEHEAMDEEETGHEEREEEHGEDEYAPEAEGKFKKEMKEEEEEEGKDSMPDRKKISSPGAMDAAIKAAVDAASKKIREEVRANERGIRDALNEVRPYVGELTMSFDSGEQVYRQALKMLNVKDFDKMHPSALKVVLGYQPKAGARAPQNDSAPMGMDEAAKDRFSKRYPGADRIGYA